MSGWDDARKVEAQAMAVLGPFFRDESMNGQFVITDKGRLSRFLQQEIGDLLMNHKRDGHLYSVELKAERRYTGNLFLETWSNKNLTDRDQHAARGSTIGWMSKLRSDCLFYYFLENDHLYIFDFFKLKRWAFGGNGEPGNLYGYREVCQSRHAQLNDTHGRIVPLTVLHREVGYRLLFPRQLELLDLEGEAA